ncbi:serine/threonine-protein kinase [Streptomyces sp. TRM70308]|uniref:serine/threonine-protein kinase n=1 Tax=Streptomyces sp. TRM70308 TaxID=3131932 RepID=UPI003D046FA6
MGEVFAGRYELVDPVGRGGMGAVWRAWDHRRKRYVAAKVLRQNDAHTLLRFVREQALRIDHPHVLAPTSWAADDDQVLFTMDLMHGGSLAHLVGDYGALPPRLVCVLLDQLLAGLAAVHAEDVVHRDVKPANILLDATGTGRPHLRLSDFGIALRKDEPRLTESAYVVGTPGYFAPEQLLGAEPDFPADLYAVGLVALYLLTGEKPDAQALVTSYEHGVPPAPEGVPEPLWQVLAGLLRPDPRARFRTATGARKALTGAVDLLAPDATPPPGDRAGTSEVAVEVFDHLGPLPPGYGPDGPDGRDGPAGGEARGSRHAAPRPPADGGPHDDADSFHLAPPAPPGTAAPEAGPGAAAQVAAPGAAAHASGAPGPGAPGPVPDAATPDAAAYDAAAYGAPVPVAAAPGAAVHIPGAPGSAHAVAGPAAAAHAAGAPGAGVPLPGPAEHGVPVRPSVPGPPGMVAVPVLVLALACFAFGIWALLQS